MDKSKEHIPARDIRSTAPVDDMTPIDSDMGKRRTSNARPLTSFEKKFYEMINGMIEKYAEYVTYKQESFLILLTLLPFPVLAGLLPLLDSIVFLNNSYGLGLKIVTMVLGLMALKASELVNNRHVTLSAMVMIVNGDATIRDVCNVIKGKGHNRMLTWTAYIFCACLVAAELSIIGVPEYSSFGQGVALQIDLKGAANQNYSLDFFQASVGAQVGCFGCVGYKSRDILFIPVSDKLINGASLEHDSDVIMQSLQDIVSLDVSCFVVTPTPRPIDTNLRVQVLGFNYGVQTSFMDFEISSFNTQGVLRARRCTFISRDWSGIAKVRYTIADSGTTARKAVEFVGPIDPTNCTSIGDLCLNNPTHVDISVALIKSAFPQSTFNIDRAYSQNFHMFPDPGKSMSDTNYADLVANAVGMNFLLGANQFRSTEVITDLETDQVAVKLRMQSWLMILTIVSASICTLIAIILIIADILRLGKTSDVILRRLSFTLKPGKGNIESIADYIYDIIKDGSPAEDWDLAPVRFGEDRKTMLEPLGKLRFGGKKDIVKFKIGRAYY
jgi:hypothetical protein